MPKLLLIITVLVFGNQFWSGDAHAALRVGNTGVMASNADLSRQHGAQSGEPKSLPPRAYSDARPFLR